MTEHQAGVRPWAVCGGVRGEKQTERERETERDREGERPRERYHVMKPPEETGADRVRRGKRMKERKT